MRRRTWIIRIGDHWFLRNIRDVYESIASRYTSRNEPRGIQSLYPDSLDSPFFWRYRVALLENNLQASSYSQRFPSSGYVTYYKDELSAFSFDHPLAHDTQLHLFLVGEFQSSAQALNSMERSSDYHFSIDNGFIVRYLDVLLRQVQLKPTRQQPLNITLVASHTASYLKEQAPFALHFLRALHSRGYRHVMVCAPSGQIAAPYWGKSLQTGEKVHFYLANHTIYRIAKEKDWRARAIKVLTQCMLKTRVPEKKVFLEACIQEVSSLGYITRCDKLNRLKSCLRAASENHLIKLYAYGTKGFMRFFNCRSRSETKLKDLVRAIENDNSICSVVSTL